MIQIVGLRHVNNSPKPREVFIEKGWRFNTIEEVFTEANRTELINRIPENERWNLYFTVADCFEERIDGKGRVIKEQHALPFDIDHIDFKSEETIQEQCLESVKIACEIIGVPMSEVGIIFSGHGVQFFIKIKKFITSPDYFEGEAREHYKWICKKIDTEFKKRGLSGEMDTSVFSHARIMRLPDTENRKKGKPNRTARCLQPLGLALDFELEGSSGLEQVNVPETIKRFPRPDTPAVCEGCSFLKHCNTNQDKISEPAWYAMVCVTAWLGPEGREIAHKYSEKHPNYNYHETDLKVDQALKAAGPRTCKDISQRWDGCPTCPNYQKVTSPVMIKGLNYIATKDMGFRHVNQNGKPGGIAFDDLEKQFEQEYPYFVIDGEEELIVYNGTHWEPMSDLMAQAWAKDKINPSARSYELKEFYGGLVRRKSHLITRDQMFDTTAGKLNFKNMVLDIVTGETSPHSQEYGFFNTLPFDYDPHAKSEIWEEFLKSSMEGDMEKVQLLKEFGGYAISGDECWTHKALLLIGDGENGKSVYMETLGKVVGDNNFSAVSLSNLGNPNNLVKLKYSLFNTSDETKAGAFYDSELFKTLVQGGIVTGKILYKNLAEFKNKSKLIISLNHELLTNDLSHGFFRRLIPIRFNKMFVFGTPDYKPHLKRDMWQPKELSGIVNSLIDAYRTVKSNMTFSSLHKIKEETDRIRMDNDPLLMFLDEMMTVGAEERVVVTEMYAAYVDYCKNNNYKPLNNVHFARGIYKKNRNITAYQSNGVRYLKGVSLRKDF